MPFIDERIVMYLKFYKIRLYLYNFFCKCIYVFFLYNHFIMLNALVSVGIKMREVVGKF